MSQPPLASQPTTLQSPQGASNATGTTHDAHGNSTNIAQQPAQNQTLNGPTQAATGQAYAGGNAGNNYQPQRLGFQYYEFTVAGYLVTIQSLRMMTEEEIRRMENLMVASLWLGILALSAIMMWFF